MTVAFLVDFWHTPQVLRTDRLYVAVMSVMILLAVVPWWISALLPLQDYPQFLVFVRAMQDYRDPASPFYGTYTVVDWPLTPTFLSLHLTRLLVLVGGSVENGGKLLLTLHAVGLPLASAYLLKVFQRNRWCVLFVFPLVHSYWTIGGFAAYGTSFTGIVLTLAFAVRWLQTQRFSFGVLTALGTIAVFLWHGIAFLVLGLALCILWLCWRARSIRERAFSVLPMIPAAILFVVWSQFMTKTSPAASPPVFVKPKEALAHLFEYVGPIVPHGAERSIALVLLLILALAVGSKSRPPGRTEQWRARNPFLLISAALLAAYFVLPLHANGVAGISNRFVYAAVLSLVFACSPARAAYLRRFVFATGALAGIFVLGDMVMRFHVFHRYTAGASRLMDRMKTHQTLYLHAGPGTVEFPGNSMIELQQFATARHGGLPNSSFAGYGTNYVRYVGGVNPMPGINGPPRYSAKLTKFDYVIIRGSASAYERASRQFQFIARDGDWTLLGVCGSKTFPSCKP